MAEEGNHASECCLEILLLWHRQCPCSFIEAGWTSAPRLKRSGSSHGAWGGDGHGKDVALGAQGGLLG